MLGLGEQAPEHGVADRAILRMQVDSAQRQQAEGRVFLAVLLDLQLPGLRRKHYFLSEQGDRAGGIYFWDSRAAAEACYSDAWKEMVTAKYGAPPEIRFYEVPVSVDNLSGRIETD